MNAVVQVERVSEVLARAPARREVWLSPSEQLRAARLRVPERLAHYLAGHWLLRESLALALEQDPQQIVLIERENQPPQVAGAELRLSLSHSGDWIACAWSTLAIGIDLEQRRPRPALRRFADLLLAVDEAADALDEDALLQRWVVKESLIKRDGGSALPEQLAALRIRASAAAAQVELISSDDYHLGIASAWAPELRIGQRVLARAHWALLTPHKM